MSIAHGGAFQRGQLFPTQKSNARRSAAKALFMETTATKVPVGRFGNIFENLSGFEPSNAAIAEVAATMEERVETDNSNIPLAFAFFGQFIDHDITFDPVSRLDERLDPQAVRNFRTPALDLDNVYGEGPDASRHLYDTRGADMDSEHRLPIRLLTGDTAHPRDLPRNAQGTAIIGDPRNDENLLVSQVHAAMLRFHNSVVDHLLAEGAGNPPANKDLFEEARRIVTTHYHYVVLTEFLPLLCGQDVVDDVLLNGRQFFKWEERSDRPYIPTEFGGAAYRMGHTLIRNRYQLNDEFSATKTIELFDLPFFGLEKDPDVFPIAEVTPPQDKPLHGPVTGGYDPRYALDLAYFVDVGDATKLQFCRPVDGKVAQALFKLPFIHQGQDAPNSLPERNMRRGRTLKLPSGQAVAQEMGFTPRTNPELGIDSISGLNGQAPLWFYILKESELDNTDRDDGTSRLGKVAARLVTEVLIGLIEVVQESYDPFFQFANLKPSLVADGEPFGLAEMLTFADA